MQVIVCVFNKMQGAKGVFRYLGRGILLIKDIDLARLFRNEHVVLNA
jgi:hypothetical protein